MTTVPVDGLRARCLALPEVVERVSHGEPAWFIGGRRMFVMYAEAHHDDVVGFWCAAPDGVQVDLVEQEPGRFYRPPYVGHRGWLGVRLDVAVDWDEVTAIVHDAYRTVAPQRLIPALDASPERSAPGAGRVRPAAPRSRPRR